MTRTSIINSVKLRTLYHRSSTIDLHSQKSKLNVYKEQLFSLHSPSSSTASLSPSPIQLTKTPNFKTPLFQPQTPPICNYPPSTLLPSPRWLSRPSHHRCPLPKHRSSLRRARSSCQRNPRSPRRSPSLPIRRRQGMLR